MHQGFLLSKGQLHMYRYVIIQVPLIERKVWCELYLIERKSSMKNSYSSFQGNNQLLCFAIIIFVHNVVAVHLHVLCIYQKLLLEKRTPINSHFQLLQILILPQGPLNLNHQICVTQTCRVSKLYLLNKIILLSKCQC